MKTAEETVKKLALERNQDLYYQIKEEDLIAKEFKYHRHCYKNFTRKTPSESKTQIYEKRDFEPVRTMINEEVIKNCRILPMNELYKAYGIELSDKRNKYYLRQLIQSKFNEEIIMLCNKDHSDADYVASKEKLTEASYVKEDVVKKAAKYLRDDILEQSKSVTPLQWPPSLEQLTSEERKPPDSTQLFFKTILNPSKSSRLVDSFSQDLVYGVGKTLTEKHFLMALGLHNMTGQRNVIEVLSKFGQCISYKQTCEILKANAESVIQRSKLSSLLPINPETEQKIVLTYFWVDNFDLLTDARYGGGSINITTMMAFQEGKVENNRVHVPVTRKSDRQLSNEKSEIVVGRFNPLMEPPTQRMNLQTETFNFDDKDFILSYFKWVLARRESSISQTVPTFSGHLFNKRISKGGEVHKTIETYLPPINSKVCFFFTVKS